MTRPKPNLTPLDPDQHVHVVAVLRAGARFRRELWGATSADGTWRYRRQENTGTDWTITHVPTGRTHEHYSSLRQARLCTASGYTLRCLDNPIVQTESPTCEYVSPWTGRRTGCLYTPESGTTLCSAHTERQATG